MLHVYLKIHVALIGAKERSLETYQEALIFRKSRSVGKKYFRLGLRRSACKVDVMFEFSQNGNMSTNFSYDKRMRFPEYSLCGNRIYHAGRTGGQQTDMTRLLENAFAKL
jgi:hypothetical protein